MADNGDKSTLKSTLNEIAQNVKITANNTKANIELPSGEQSKDNNEVQYTLLDFITGIAGAAFFGLKNKKANNIKDIIGYPEKSVFAQIKNYLTNTDKNSNLQSTVSNAINSSLENLIKGNADINVKLITDANQNKNQDSSTGTNEAAKILIDIKNGDSLAKLIEELTYANEFGQFDKLINSFGWLNQILEKISNLNVDSVNLTNNIESFKVLLEYFDEHKNITVPDFSSLRSIDQTALDSFTNMINNLSGLSSKLTKENVESVNDIFILLNNLNRSLPDEKEGNKIKNNINQLTNIFKNNQGGLTELYNAIQSAFKDSSLTIENIKGLNEVLNSVITIVSFDKDINTDVIYELEQLLTDGGVVRNIIKDINAISGEITGNSAKSLSILNSYIASLTAIGDIGLISKINMMINFEFFKFYVNKQLPSLIKDINDNFKDLSSPANLEVLESLEDYFSYIKNIGFVSVKDMINMTLNIEFLRHFALKEIKKLIDEISTEFGKIDYSKSSLSNISKLFANLMSITNIDASKIDDQRKNLSNIRKLIFGETIFGKRLGFLSNLRYSSISQIIEMINNFGKDLGDTTNNVNNIKKIMLLLNKNIISLKLDEKGAKVNIKILTLVHKKELPALEKSIKYIKKIGEDYNDLDLTEFANVLEKIKNATDKNSVKEIFDKLFVDKDATKRILNTYAAFSNLKLLTKTLVWFGKIDESVIEKSLKPLTKLAEGLNIVINKFNFDEKKLKTAIKVLKELELFLLKTSLILILSVLALSFFTLEDVFKYVLGISVLLGGVYIILRLLSSKEFNDIENKLKIIQQISKMLAILSLSFAISLKIMQGVDWETLKILGASIIGSLVICGGIVLLVNIFKNSFNKSIPIAKDLAILMFTLSISLALGAFIAQTVSLEHIKTFGGLLGVLIIALAAPLFVLRKGSSVLFQGGKDLGILILMVSASLVLGSFIAQIIPVEDIAKFGVILAGLIVSLAVPLLVVSIFGKAMIQGGKDLGLIMMYTTLSLLIGGLFIMVGGEKLVKAIDEFKLTLLSFVSGLLIAYGFASLLGKSGMEHAKTLNKIILISALSLLIGGALFMIDGFKEAVNDFALTLWLFITGVSLALGIAAYFAQDGLKYAWQIALIVAVTSLAMTLGPLLLKEHGVDYSDVFCFLLNSAGFIAAIGALAYFAGKFAAEIGIGLLVVGAIGLLIFGMAWVFSKSYDLLSPIKWLNLIGDLGLAMLTLTAIGVFIGAIGTLGMIVWPFLAVGATIFAGIELIIIGLAETVSMVAKAINDLKKLGSVGDMDQLLKPFGDFIEAAISNLTVNPLKLGKLKLASSAMSSVGSMISSLAKGVKAYASLTIPEYDANGKEIGRRQLKETDFKDAANNVSIIIKTVGGAIMDLMTNTTGKDAELMKELMQPAGLFKSSTKFGKLIKSLTSIGGLISTYAKGIQDYAQLKVPQTDDKGNIIEGKFRLLKPGEIEEAKKKISEIIIAMGEAIVGAVEKDTTGIFKGNNSKASNAIKAITDVSGVIGTIADSIAAYATHKFPILDYKDGKLTTTKRIHLYYKDINEAANVIRYTIERLAFGILNAYNNKKLTSIWNSDEEDSPVKKVSKAITSISNTIGTLNTEVEKLIKINKSLPDGDLSLLYNKLNIYLCGDNKGKKGIYNIVEFMSNTNYSNATYVETIINNNEDLKKKFNNIGAILSLISTLANDINKSINAINQIKPGDYNIFADIINSIYNAISNIKDTTEFNNHINSLKNYVTTINSIDVSKVQSFVSLIDSINSLGDKMENLDSFTTALADKLTSVLQNLAAKLDEAKKSIKDADALHSKREKLIKGSVNTIKELMKQEMIVKIEQEDKPSPGGGTPGGNPGSGGSKSPSGGANVTAEGGNDTTINNTSINKGNSGGGNNNSSSVDIDALASAIANKMRAVLDERNIGS